MHFEFLEWAVRPVLLANRAHFFLFLEKEIFKGYKEKGGTQYNQERIGKDRIKGFAVLPYTEGTT